MNLSSIWLEILHEKIRIDLVWQKFFCFMLTNLYSGFRTVAIWDIVLEATYSKYRKGMKRSNENVTKICMNCTNESLHVTEKNDIYIYLYEEYIYNKMITLCDVFKWYVVYGITYLYIGGPVPSTSELYRYCTAINRIAITSSEWIWTNHR